MPGEDTSGVGDALGIYALQLLPCAGSAQGPTRTGALGPLRAKVRVIGERALDVLVGVAQANHRERFDGPAAAEFGKRLALDRAATTTLGTLVAPLAQYCKVGLVLARLPSQGAERALPFSLRLSKASDQVLVIDFRENLEIALTRPWAARGAAARLTIVLRPKRALHALTMSGLEEGERMQRTVVSLATEATASIDAK